MAGKDVQQPRPQSRRWWAAQHNNMVHASKHPSNGCRRKAPVHQLSRDVLKRAATAGGGLPRNSAWWSSLGTPYAALAKPRSNTERPSVEVLAYTSLHTAQQPSPGGSHSVSRRLAIGKRQAQRSDGGGKGEVAAGGRRRECSPKARGHSTNGEEVGFGVVEVLPSDGSKGIHGREESGDLRRGLQRIWASSA